MKFIRPSRNTSIKLFINYWLPVLLYLGFIFFISSIPNLEIKVIRFGDKFAHMLEYAILGYLLMRALISTKRISLKVSFLFAILFILNLWSE